MRSIHPPQQSYYYLSAAAAISPPPHHQPERDTNREKGEVANQHYHCSSLAICGGEEPLLVVDHPLLLLRHNCRNQSILARFIESNEKYPLISLAVPIAGTNRL